MSVDLWKMENVVIHLRQGYGGQDVKVLPVPVFNANEAWERVMGWSGECFVKPAKAGVLVSPHLRRYVSELSDEAQ